ncbi:fucose permease [Sediminihabitans luteus]|uniref:Fucose permease n=1 Tax=Sediminihabitans luteus TaxID=1138585 RepID=A0A2M9CCX7_9CELL|nr:MFS transporter [Sediminihabitans luteus]PJJ69242.1 fucose permease [Sediminihabitans luteus]GII98918.1 MFS transporter [Sediminihabitans luteus]
MTPSSTVARARWSLLVLFAVMGLTFSSWLTRLPSIREDLDVTSTQLGSLLIVGAVGSLAAVIVTGAVVSRFGSRTVLYVTAVGNMVGFGILALGVATGSVELFAVGAFLNGVCGAASNIPINLNGAIIEQRVGRAILPHFHAAFSIGAALGTLVGAWFSAAHVSASAHILIVAVVVGVVRLALIGPASALQPPTIGGRSAHVDGTPRPRGAAVRSALSAWTERRTVLIGLVILAGSLSEGSAGNWLSISVVDGFDQKEAVGSLAYGTFIVAMTVFRMAGTRVIDRYGRVTVLRASAVSSLVGLLAFGLSPSIVLAWVGIVLWGFGAALGNPIAIAAASDDPTRAAARVSVVTSFSSMAQLSAPPLLGLLADGIGARHALLTICAATVLSFVLAGQVAPLRTKSAPTDVDDAQAGPGAPADPPLDPIVADVTPDGGSTTAGGTLSRG